MSSVRKIKLENNIYYKDNPKYFLELKELVEKYPCHYSRILKYTRKDIMQWINDNVKLLNDPVYLISTKVSWILNNRTNFPICEVCNKSNGYLKRNLSATNNYIKTCSISCNKKHPDVINKTKETNKKKYKTEYTFQSKKIKEKIKQTNVEKYGVENVSQSKMIQQKKIKTRQENLNKQNDFQYLNTENKNKYTNIEKYKKENFYIIEKIKENIYYKNNPKYFLEIKEIFEKYPFSYSSILKFKRKDLYKWIIENTPLLTDSIYTIATKVTWILNGLTDFPICPICQTNDKYKLKNTRPNECYKKYCSEKCASSSQETLEKIKQTSLKNYGVEYHIQSEKVKEKYKQNSLKKYGVDNPSKTKKVQEKIKATCQQKYGFNSPFEVIEIQEKIKETNLKKFGVENPFASKEIQKKIKQTNLKNFGVENPSSSEYIKEKRKNTFLDRYNVEYPVYYAEFRRKIAVKYKYNNIGFDSAPEIAFYIWLTDHNRNFKYHPDVKFTYMYNNKKHYYIPDFKVDKKYIEIKGNHFVNEDGTWKCPFDRSHDGQAEAKRQCLISNNVEIKYEEQYLKYIKYVENKYGKDYIKQFKRNV